MSGVLTAAIVVTDGQNLHFLVYVDKFICNC